MCLLGLQAAGPGFHALACHFANRDSSFWDSVALFRIRILLLEVLVSILIILDLDSERRHQQVESPWPFAQLRCIIRSQGW